MSLPGEYRKLNTPSECEVEGCTHQATYALCTESDGSGGEWTNFCDIHMPGPDAKDDGDVDERPKMSVQEMREMVYGDRSISNYRPVPKTKT